MFVHPVVYCKRVFVTHTII